MATNVTVPMVGKIVAVTVKVGDQVAENDQIATLEAMKMEMPVVAPTGGVIKPISMDRITNAAYQMGSTPAALIMGLNTGTVIQTMEIPSRRSRLRVSSR